MLKIYPPHCGYFTVDKALCHVYGGVQRREYQISKTLSSTPTKTDSILKPGIPPGLSGLGDGDGSGVGSGARADIILKQHLHFIFDNEL